jgi:hypothetical protein
MRNDLERGLEFAVNILQSAIRGAHLVPTRLFQSI